MENSEAPQARGTLDVRPGKFADGQFGVSLMMNEDATILSGDGEIVPGMMMLPWQARLLAYTLLHQAEAVEHGLRSSANC